MSPEWRTLRDRRMRLRKDLLPRRFSRLGRYTEKQRYNAAAFRFLFNAELETYFEALAKRVAKHAEDEWVTRGKITIAFAALSASSLSSISAPQQDDQIQTASYLDRKFRDELTNFRRSVNRNNGAKSHNILKMFVPIGIDETLIDPALIAECDALASRRGTLAHQSSHGVISLIDPRDDFDKTNSILSMLKDFENLVEF